MNETPLAQRLGVGLLDRADQPGRPVADHEQRAAHAWYSSVICWQMTDTVDLEIAAWSPSASARVASTSRTDRPRTKDAITSDSRALVLVTCAPNRREANASVVPRSFGRASPTGPAVVLTVTSR